MNCKLHRFLVIEVAGTKQELNNDDDEGDLNAKW